MMLMSWRQRLWPTLGLVLFAYPLVPGLDGALDQALGLPIQIERLIVSWSVFGLLCLSVQLQLGQAGLMQLGSAAFYGIGAYSFGLATVAKLPLQLPFVLALCLATAMGALAGAVLGVCCARVEGDALALVTLAFAEVLRSLALNGDGITDGSRGLNPLSLPELPAWLPLPVHAAPGSGFLMLYWLALGSLLCARLLLARLAAAPYGRALSAMRCDRLAAEACGLAGARLRLSTMALGGAMAALGGALYAAYLTTTGEPNTYDFNVSVMALTAVVLGGAASPSGALAGAALLVVFDVALSPWPTPGLAAVCPPALAGAAFTNFANYRWLLFGGLLVVTMRQRPGGLVRLVPR